MTIRPKHSYRLFLSLKPLAWRLALSLFILAALAGPGAELLRQAAR